MKVHTVVMKEELCFVRCQAIVGTSGPVRRPAITYGCRTPSARLPHAALECQRDQPPHHSAGPSSYAIVIAVVHLHGPGGSTGDAGLHRLLRPSPDPRVGGGQGQAAVGPGEAEARDDFSECAKARSGTLHAYRKRLEGVPGNTSGDSVKPMRW